jgi:hypothetical protein
MESSVAQITESPIRNAAAFSDALYARKLTLWLTELLSKFTYLV